MSGYGGTEPAARRSSEETRGARARDEGAARRSLAAAAFAKPTQPTSDDTSSGAASGRPCSSVTETPSSRAMSSVHRSYGWQHSAAPPGRSPLEERPQVGDETIVTGHELVQLTAAWRCIDLRTTAPCPAAAVPAAAATTSSSIAASSARLPGKKREIVANPCASVVARDGCRLHRCCSPVSRLKRTA